MWFGAEMGTRSRIKARNWRKTSASYRYVQLSELYHLLQLALIHSLHEYKEYNLNKISESLEWFGTEMGTRSRIKTRKWRNTSASYRYVQLSDLYHLLQLALIHSLHEYKEFNLNKINESLVWFGAEMGTRSRIKARNWRKTSASYRYVQLSELYHLLQLALIHSLHEYKEYN